MSLILEALRKSEADRRRGLPPDLHAELPPAPARRNTGMPTWWWLLPLVAVLAIGGWLLLRDTPRTQAPQASAPVATTPEPATPPPATAAPAPALPERAPGSAAPSTTAPALPAPRSEPQPAAIREPAVAQRPAPPPPAPARPAPVPAPVAASPPSPPPADSGRVLSVGELDADTRRALPPLKLSMHLWNEDPAQRFVILDGQRLGEGDRVGEATITRIERDGVLLAWNGRGIRVPVR